MRRFFRSKRFWWISGILTVLIALTVAVAAVGGWAAPQNIFLGSVVMPIQRAFSAAADNVSGFFGMYGERDALKQENAELREELDALKQEKLTWQEALNENEFYKEFLGLKEEHGDYLFCSARVVARDPADIYAAMTLDAGSLDGVSAHDVVITADGLVGYVTAVAPTYCTVATLLDPAVNVGAYDRRTDDSGIVSGSLDTAPDGTCIMTNLDRYATVVAGDTVVTTGGSGLFPAGLVVGTVESVVKEEGALTLRASVRPAADLLGCRNVMIITAFEGQGEVAVPDTPEE